MAMSPAAKTWWLLLLGAAAIVLVLVPLRLTPVVPESIDALSLQTRSQLIQMYEKPAQQLKPRADSLRKFITSRFGGTRPSQDSLLATMETTGDRILTVLQHVKDPRRATFDEKRQEVLAGGEVFTL